MKSKRVIVAVLALLCCSALAQAQETSRVIPFNNLATSLPADTTQSVTAQLWDVASGGTTPLFAEGPFNVNVDANGNISFAFGSQTTGGLDPANFPSGSSRYLDVVDSGGASVLPGGRIALNATAFALSPGPPGPKGDKGDQGDAGPPGPVSSVTAGDASIAIGGTPSAPTVAVAANGITNANVANGALSPLKIAGTAATLGTNNFVGTQNITGSLNASGSFFLSGNFFANTVATNLFQSGGNATIRGNGLDIQIGNVGCGPPTAGIGASPVSCSNFFLGFDAAASSTFINRPTGGSILFHEGNGADQMRIFPGGRVGINLPVVAPQAQLHIGAPSLTDAIKFQVLSGANFLVGELRTGDVISRTFRVAGNGIVFANEYRVGGADFAESVEPLGEKSAYEPGDVLVIEASKSRAVALAAEPYSTRVAGIYSTKPGMLATPYGMDDPRLAKEIPLAMVGIVPCKVSAENGPIGRGDLLVTSSTPGHAMKGTDRSRLVGAVVGKALEPLSSGKGVIQVLVTLQ